MNGKAIANYLNKAFKAICEIKLSNGFGSGFFCKIPYTENDNLLLPVLMSCYHVLSKDFLNSKDDIKIVINDENKTISLKGRKIWINEKMDYTCIEIKEKEDNIHTFYNLDDNAFDDKYSNDNYLNQKVLIFAINKNDKQIGFSNGLILKNKDCFFAYNCNTYPGCSGGCIVNQLDNHVIGIHEGEIKLGNKNKVNQGIYIKNIIKNIKITPKGNFLSNVK